MCVFFLEFIHAVLKLSQKYTIHHLFQGKDCGPNLVIFEHIIGAGPYRYNDTLPGASYWIPGRLQWRPSMPTPPDGSTTAHPNLDLMFLHSHRDQTSHSVWLDSSVDKLARVGGVLPPGVNIVSVPAAPLKAGSKWWWRVDVVDSHSGKTLVTGEVWSFMVRSGSPPVPPTPQPPSPSPSPPPSPPPAPTGCKEAEDKLCPNMGGKGNACESCVLKHQRDFEKAQCWSKHDRHAFLKKFCDGSTNE